MSNDNERSDDLSRRDFLRSAGILGAGTMLAGAGLAFGCKPKPADETPADEKPAEGTPTEEAPVEETPAEESPAEEALAEDGLSTVPTRTFGRTGEQVSMLALGGTIDTSSQLMLRQAINHGVTYWDTAWMYSGGASEVGMGNFFADNSGEREKVFLVTKSGQSSAAGLTNELATSLKRLQTDHVDLFFMHGLKHPARLNEEARQWAAEAKAEGKIRYFGFSTHASMAQMLARAAELDWIDGIMLKYNFRLMHDDAMAAAVDACVEAGIGLTAMKTQVKGQHTSEDISAELMDGLAAEGYTQHQAALKVLWAEGKMASICSKMKNTTELAANVAAARNRTELSAASMRGLAQYAAATTSDYCGGCGKCDKAVAGQVPVCDVMRYVMYYKSYGDKYEARQLFAALPAETRRKLTNVDYSAAERGCPQNVPIAQRMREAADILA